MADPRYLDRPIASRWWAGRADERFWLELSYREDFGVDLNAPDVDERGRPHAAYFLIRDVLAGDVVFHYSMRDAAITSWSRAIGAPFADPVVWGPMAGPMATRPAAHARPGWRVGLEGPFPLDPAVSLADLRASEPAIRSARSALAAGTTGTLYFPFDLSTLRPLRPAQFYLAKLPASVVQLFPALTTAAAEARATAVGDTVAAPPVTTVVATGNLGRPYQSRPKPTRSSPSDPWSLDPDVLDRGRTGHWATQEALADFIDSLGGEAREPEPDEPKYDVGWELSGRLSVAEVKSLTKANQESQLRLGLGQVLRYRHLVSAATSRPVTAVLAVERAPDDPRWSDLCSSLGVILVWPGNMSGLAP